MLEILSVQRRSPFHRAGVKKGEYIIAFDGHKYQDQLDIAYYSSLSSFDVTIRNKKGKERIVRIEKDEDEDLGIEYPYEDFDIKVCKNKCLFCFVEQCKKGMRPSLYVKDDDYRLSFTCGSYVTLSNVTEDDLERIERLKLSPLYISVHCYDKEIKKKLCANPNSAKVFDYMQRLAKAGIVFQTQIVMAEGLNSDDVLVETINELYKLFPHVETVAVVPVGLTGHREGLYPLKPVSRECAARTLDFCESFAEECLKKHGTRFVWCSDEMYVLAGRPIPKYVYYENFVQIENGVGMVAEFIEEADEELKEATSLRGGFTCVTGVAFSPTLTALADRLKKERGIDLEVMTIKNEWFGETVTVAGLLTASDMIPALKKRKYADVIIPSTTLKEFEDVFLDGVTMEEFKKEISARVYVSHGGKSLIEILEGKYD
ncbi:MAG: DUF512 domain-containing protein [Clostridia bacterium]|nr:DUF512 domain-containing protein [Clostridia bacterium]